MMSLTPTVRPSSGRGAWSNSPIREAFKAESPEKARHALISRSCVMRATSASKSSGVLIDTDALQAADLAHARHHALHATHHFRHAAALHHFHHLLHLFELREDAIDLLHRHPRASRDPPLA